MSAAFAAEVLLRAEQSGGAISVLENSVPGRWAGPPLHRHDFDEAFYVLEGELTFQLGDDLSTAGEGDFVFAPRNSVHTLANRSTRPARYLLTCTPAGFERTLARRLAEEPASPHPPGPSASSPRWRSSAPRSPWTTGEMTTRATPRFGCPPEGAGVLDAGSRRRPAPYTHRPPARPERRGCL